MSAAIATVNTDLSKMHAFGNMYIVIGEFAFSSIDDTYTVGGLSINWGSLVKATKQPIFIQAIPNYAQATDVVFQFPIAQGDPTQSLATSLFVITSDGSELENGSTIGADFAGHVPFMAIFQGQL